MLSRDDIAENLEQTLETLDEMEHALRTRIGADRTVTVPIEQVRDMNNHPILLPLYAARIEALSAYARLLEGDQP